LIDELVELVAMHNYNDNIMILDFGVDKFIATKEERPTASRDGVFSASWTSINSNQMRRNQKNDCRIYDCYVNSKNNLLQ